MIQKMQGGRHRYVGSVMALVATVAVVAGSLAASAGPASAAGKYRHHHYGSTTTTSTTTPVPAPTVIDSFTINLTAHTVTTTS